MLSLRADIAERIRSGLLQRNELYRAFFNREAEPLAQACRAMSDRFLDGGRLLAFGRGPLEPANITALANDVGTEVIFLRQLIAQARPDDVVFAFSTSGGSRNIVMALEEARQRGLSTIPWRARAPSGRWYCADRVATHRARSPCCPRTSRFWRWARI